MGEILGVGTREGTRIIVGNWAVSPYGAFADVMVERSDGHRLLLAPTRPIAEYVAQTYSFDEILVVPVVVDRSPHGGFSTVVGPLKLSVTLGARTATGWALHLLPRRITGRVWFSRLTDPIARILLPGVRTHGTAGGGRHEFYGAHDVRSVTSLVAAWGGRSLGGLAPVEPAPRFGFGSTPRVPTLTRVTTTVVRAVGDDAHPKGRQQADG